MPVHLSLILEDHQFSAIERAAHSSGITVAEWVCRTLRQGLRTEQAIDSDSKLLTIRKAVRGSYPIADIDQMLAEIESGRTWRPAVTSRGFMRGTILGEEDIVSPDHESWGDLDAS